MKELEGKTDGRLGEFKGQFEADLTALKGKIETILVSKTTVDAKLEVVYSLFLAHSKVFIH